MKLFCVIVGVPGSAFPVDIDAGETVGDLKKAIKAEKSKITCDADELQLFLAKTESNDSLPVVYEWLQSSSEDVKKLKKGEKTALLELLTKEDQELQAEDPLEDVLSGIDPPSVRQIHVLVVVPEKDGGGALDDSRLARMELKMDRLYEKSATVVYRISKMSSTKGRKLRQQLHILLVDVNKVPFLVSASRPVEQFEWESVKTKLGQDVKLTEEQHRKPYLAYVERNIGAVLSKENLCVLGVEHQNLLHVKIPGHNIELSGWTDLLILSADVKKHPHRLEELPDVRMLIEVKQEMKGGASSQTISELMALDLMTAAPVMALLTDLKKTWQFFWVSEMRNDSIIIHTAVFEKPGDAFEVIRTLLQQPSRVDVEIEFACFERPIKRRKLAYLLPMVSESGEEVDIRDAIERYYDIASMLGPDIQMARAVASQITRAIPAFSSPSLSYFS